MNSPGALRALAVIAATTAAIALLWTPVITGDALPFVRDLSLFALPMKRYAVERLAAGELPQWATWSSGGLPFLADAANQVLYPLNLVFLASRDAAAGLGGFVVAHSAIAIVGFYALARACGIPARTSLWAALVYGLSGYVLSITDNVNQLAGAAWAPAGLAAFCAGLRDPRPRTTAWAGGCLALLLLAGDAQDAGVLAGAFALLAIVPHGALARTATFSASGTAHVRAPAPSVRLAHLVGAIGIGTALAAVQVLPSIELATYSYRADGIDYRDLAEWSFPPRRALELVQPFLFGSNFPALDFLAPELYPSKAAPWADSVYIGLVPVALAAWAIVRDPARAAPWAIIAAGAATLSLGRNVEWHRTLVEIVPLLATQRYPEKLILWVTIAIVLLAAQGANHALQGGGPNPFGRRPEASPLIRIAGAVLVFSALFFVLYEIPVEAWLGDRAMRPSVLWSLRLPGDSTHAQGLIVHTILSAAAIAVLAALARRTRRAWMVVLLLIAIADLAWIHRGHTPLAPRDLVASSEPPTTLTALRAADGAGEYRIFYDKKAPGGLVRFSDGALARRVHTAMGMPMMPAHRGYAPVYVAEFLGARLAPISGAPHGVRYLNGQSSPLQPAHHLRYESRIHHGNAARLLAAANTGFVVTADSIRLPMWSGDGFEVVAIDSDLDLRLLRVRGALPRAYLARGTIAPQGDPIAALESRRFDLAEAVVIEGTSGLDAATSAAPKPAAALVEEGLAEKIPGEQAPGEVVFEHASPERLRITVRSAAERAWLVVAESWSPGWNASLDGVPVPIRRANARAMAIDVPRGEHRVRLAYRTPRLEAGAAISALAAVAWIALVAWPVRRER